MQMHIHNTNAGSRYLRQKSLMMHLKPMLHVVFTCATETNSLTQTLSKHPADLLMSVHSFFYRFKTQSFFQGRHRDKDLYCMTAQICVCIAARILHQPCLFVINLKETQTNLALSMGLCEHMKEMVELLTAGKNLMK